MNHSQFETPSFSNDRRQLIDIILILLACLNDGQLIKTLNELIDATNMVWRDAELNVSNNIAYNL